MSIYGSLDSPTYNVASNAQLWDQAFAQPLSLSSNLITQGKGGALESFGLGSAIRDTFIPEGNVERGIGGAAIEYLPAFRFLDDEFTGTTRPRTTHAGPPL